MSGRASMRAAEGDVTLEAAPADAVPRPQATAAVRGARGAMFKAWLPALLALLLLDVTFNHWFWHIPKLTQASADYGYQFLTDARALSTTPKRADTPRVVAIGSSVAGSFDPGQVQGLLAAGGSAADVHRLLLPGIKPSDLRLFFDTDGADVAPDVVVLLLNPLDFLNPSFERDLKPQVRTVLPPAPTLRERGAFIPTMAGKFDLALASVSNLYRYHKLLRSSVEDHLRLAWRWLRGGPAAQGYGWYADGFTRQDFGVPLAAAGKGLEYYIDPAWLAQRGAVTLTFSTAAGLIERRSETTPGWKRFEVPPVAGAGPLLFVSADSAWSPRAAGQHDTRALGVRLRDVPSAAPGRDRSPVRYPPLERAHPDTLLRMNGEQGDAFVVRWQTLLDADSDFGRRFRAYREAKLAARNEPLTPTGEYAELERLVQGFSERGASVLLINNPESALLRWQYAGDPYYRSYLDFLAGVAARQPHTQFVDLGGVLPIDDFNDWHHVTYIGAIKLGPRYAALLKPLLRAAAPAQP
ncbi:MAG: hypothetical protein ABI629_03565 [bacterium]